MYFLDLGLEVIRDLEKKRASRAGGGGGEFLGAVVRRFKPGGEGWGKKMTDGDMSQKERPTDKIHRTIHDCATVQRNRGRNRARNQRRLTH